MTESLPQWVRDVFAAVDAKDAARFVSFLSEDAIFRFANNPAASGRSAIQGAVSAFFASIHSCSHELLRFWPGATACAVQGAVTYIRLDGQRVTLPFANVFVMRGALIAEYLVYVDVTPLYAA